MYFGGKECLIPNIFYTTPQNDYSVHCLLIIQYFANRREGEDYGVNAQKLGEIKFELNNIFTSEYVKQFEFAIKYLFDKKVLRKSIYTKDDADAIEALDDNSELYISPLGNELFNMLSRDSVFFEMLRESSWRNYDNREYSNDPSIILTKSKDYNKIYIDLLDYVDYLSEKEDDIYIRGIKRNKIQEFFSAFGYSIVTNRLLEGIKNSMKYSYTDNKCENVEKKKEATINKVDMLTKYANQ